MLRRDYDVRLRGLYPRGRVPRGRVKEALHESVAVDPDYDGQVGGGGGVGGRIYVEGEAVFGEGAEREGFGDVLGGGVFCLWARERHGCCVYD